MDNIRLPWNYEYQIQKALQYRDTRACLQLSKQMEQWSMKDCDIERLRLYLRTTYKQLRYL